MPEYGSVAIFSDTDRIIPERPTETRRVRETAGIKSRNERSDSDASTSQRMNCENTAASESIRFACLSIRESNEIVVKKERDALRSALETDTASRRFSRVDGSRLSDSVRLVGQIDRKIPSVEREHDELPLRFCVIILYSLDLCEERERERVRNRERKKRTERSPYVEIRGDYLYM